MKMTFEEFLNLMQEAGVITYRFGDKDECVCAATQDYVDVTENFRIAYIKLQEAASE